MARRLLKFMKIKNIFLLAIIAVAAFLRLWKLGSIPPSLTPDEAALGYNSYSILKTGRDEYGEFLPVIFKSFGDYKPGLYIYLTVPFVAVFGLNEWAVRLPSAAAGVIAVILVYKIIIELSLNEKVRPVTNNYQRLAVISAFMLAVSPWHIHFSRGGWEANVSLTLTLAGILYFVKALEKPKLVFYSALLFAMTLLTYQGAKLSSSIVVFILLITFWKETIAFFRKEQKILFRAILVGIVVAMPIFVSLSQGKTGRLNVFSVFSYPRPQEYLQNFLDEGNEKVGDLNYYLFHSESLNFARGTMGRWFNHFGGRFLFFEGDYQNPKHTSPNNGMLLLSDMFLLIVGFISWTKTKNSKLKTFAMIWLVTAPLPAVLSRDQVHAIRALNMVIPLTLISASGLIYFLEKIKAVANRSLQVIGYLFLSVLFLGSFIYYLDSYFVHLPKHTSAYWDYGYKQIVEAVIPIQKNYKEIKVQQSFAQPYIYFLFFQKYDPANYQKQAKFTESEYKGDVGYVTNLDNISFTGIDWSVNRGDHGNLIIGDSVRIPDADSSDPKFFTKLAEIKYLNGTTAFKIIEVK
jgi:4-amino-4-deoxy-L-arabinose transferase-like glycosyltransferase